MRAYERFVSKESIQKIHEESIKILSEIGVKFEHETAIELFKKHGAKVEGDLVYIDEKLVSDSLKKVPASFEVYTGSDEKILIGGGTKLRMPAMGNIYISEKGKIRKMDNKDTIDQFKLADTSPIINASYFNYLPELETFTHQEKMFYPLAMSLKYCNKRNPMLKPDTFHLNEGESVREKVIEGIQLTKKFYGVDDHVIIGDINPISPLAYDHDPIEKLLGYCSEGQPIWICPCAMPLLTAPASIAGMIAQTNAEILAGMVLIQLIRPETPVLYGNTSASTNMRTVQLSIGAPETALVSYATAGLADLYQVPFRTGGGLSDAKDMDMQAGLESMLMIQATEECDPDLVMHCCGTIGSFNVVSFEKFLVDEEIWGFARRLVGGLDVTDKKLCFKELKKAGPRGSFLTGRTPKMYREECILPQYLNKEDPNQWQNNGSVSLRESVEAFVKERIESYTAPELTKEQNDLIKPYIPEIYRDRI